MNPHSKHPPDSDRPSEKDRPEQEPPGIRVVDSEGGTIDHRGATSFTADADRYLIIYDANGVMVAIHAPGYWDHASLGKAQA